MAQNALVDHSESPPSNTTERLQACEFTFGVYLVILTQMSEELSHGIASHLR